LLTCTSKWFDALNSRKLTDIVYFDVSKAFDTVVHSKLLHILSRCGFGGNVIAWLREFLENRTFAVDVGKSRSANKPVLSGVPQGSVLGPLLFILYILDLARTVRNVVPDLQVSLFADDVKLFYSYSLADSVDAQRKVQRGIALIEGYLQDLQLSISETKTKLLYVGSKNTRHDYTTLQGTTITSEDCIRDLGVYMTCNLFYANHISVIVQRAKTTMFRILKVFHSPHETILTRLFTVYVRPILEYATVIWSPYKKKDIELLESVQKTFTSIVYFKCHKISRIDLPCYENRLGNLKLDTLEHRRVLIDVLQVSKILLGESRVNFCDMFKLRPSSERHTAFGINVPFTKENRVFYCFHFRASRLHCNNPAELFTCKKMKHVKTLLESKEISIIRNNVII
jgi:hypothetical protein